MKPGKINIIVVLASVRLVAGVLISGCTQGTGSGSGSAGNSQQVSPAGTGNSPSSGNGGSPGSSYAGNMGNGSRAVRRTEVPHQHDPAHCCCCPARRFRAGPPECPDAPERAADEPHFRGSPARCNTAACSRQRSAFPLAAIMGTIPLQWRQQDRDNNFLRSSGPVSFSFPLCERAGWIAIAGL